MRTLRTPLIALGLGLVAAGALAQQGDSPRPTPPPAQQEAPPPASQGQGTRQAPPAQTPPRAQRPADDVFVPTEELAADEEVTFPVDI